MSIVAMTREMGSLGKDVAAGVAQSLGVPVLHHEIIGNLADKMRLRKSHVIRLLEGKANIFERLTTDQTALSIYTADETFGLAAQYRAAVIRGWGATHLLRPVRHVVCVRVCAPLALRVERMKQRLNTDDEDFVVGEIKASDEAHGAITRRHFGVNWQDPELYDLVLNTERVPIDECVDEVLRLVNHHDFGETDASRARLADLSLQARIRAALREVPDTSKIDVTIEVRNKVATLSGMVDTAAERERAEQVAAGVDDVASVDNRLRVTRGSRFKLDG